MIGGALASYRALFGEQRTFRRFWAGFAAAVTADEVVRISFVWFVYAHTGSAAAVSWLMVCFTAPLVVGGLLAGWILDRFDRRLVMLIDNVVRALAIALVPLLHVVGALAPWHLYGLAILFGLLMMIPLAGTPTLIPALVPVERRQTANALEMLGFTAGGVAGPSIGGVLIATVGAPLAVLLSVASYLLFAWSLAGIPPQPPGPRRRQASATRRGGPAPARQWLSAGDDTHVPGLQYRARPVPGLAAGIHRDAPRRRRHRLRADAYRIRRRRDGGSGHDRRPPCPRAAGWACASASSSVLPGWRHWRFGRW